MAHLLGIHNWGIRTANSNSDSLQATSANENPVAVDMEDPKWQKLAQGNFDGKIWGFTRAQWKEIFRAIESARKNALQKFNPLIRRELEKASLILIRNTNNAANTIVLFSNCGNADRKNTAPTNLTGCTANAKILINIQSEKTVSYRKGGEKIEYMWEERHRAFLESVMVHEFLHVVFSLFCEHSQITGNPHLIDLQPLKADMERFYKEDQNSKLFVDLNYFKNHGAYKYNDSAYDEIFAYLGDHIATEPRKAVLPEYLVNHYRPIFTEAVVMDYLKK